MWWTSWILRAEKFAYGQLNLTPREFWSMTPREYNQVADGYYRRRRHEREDVAAWVCILINHFPMRGKSAKTLRVEQLIGYSTEQIAEIRKKRAAMEKQEPPHG